MEDTVMEDVREDVRVGNRVRVIGLVSSPQFNGKTGRVLKMVAKTDPQRAKVRLEDDDHVLCVKMENLQKIDSFVESYLAYAKAELGLTGEVARERAVVAWADHIGNNALSKKTSLVTTTLARGLVSLFRIRMHDSWIFWCMLLAGVMDESGLINQFFSGIAYALEHNDDLDFTNDVDEQEAKVDRLTLALNIAAAESGHSMTPGHEAAKNACFGLGTVASLGNITVLKSEIIQAFPIFTNEPLQDVHFGSDESDSVYAILNLVSTVRTVVQTESQDIVTRARAFLEHSPLIDQNGVNDQDCIPNIYPADWNGLALDQPGSALQMRDRLLQVQEFFPPHQVDLAQKRMRSYTPFQLAFILLYPCNRNGEYDLISSELAATKPNFVRAS